MLAVKVILRVLGGAALLYAGYVHLALASRYDGGGALSTGNQFRAQFAAAVVAAVILLVPRRWAWWPAIAVAAASAGAAVASVYLKVGAVGPLPALPHEPWYAEKAQSALAEVLVVVLGLVSIWASTRTREARTPPTGEATAPGLIRN